MKIDPNSYVDKGAGGKSCGPGQKVLAAVAVERGTSQNSNAKLDVRWFCVEDLSAKDGDGGDKGGTQWDTFALTAAASWRLGQVSKALGWAQPFDTDSDEEVSQVFTSGYVVATVVMENGTDGVARGKVKRYAPCSLPEGADWPDLVAAAEEEHKAWRAKGGGKAKQPRADSPNRYGEGGLGPGVPDDDIPF